jgi:L-malate glycosyltransferase
MHIALIGPCAPFDLLDLLHEKERVRAQSFPGYQGIPVSSLARELVHRGHLVSVVSTSENVKCPESFHGESLAIHVVPSQERPRERARNLWAHERTAMTELLQELKPDVVHAHWTYEFALAALATRLPTLVTAHDAPLTILRHYRDPYRAVRLAMALWVRAKRPPLTAVSPYLAERWRREMGWRRAIAVIPNITPFEPSHGIRDKVLGQRVVTVSDSSQRKNVRAALCAWPKVLESFPSAELHLVGHGLGLSEDLARWAEERSLRQQVFWHGPVGRVEVEQLIRSAIVLLHPSFEESQGLVLLEAMALAVPVVGGHVSGGVPWTIGDAGVLADVRSPIALAAKVVDLLGNPEQCKRLGEAGRRRVADIFSPEAVASAYEDQYAAVIKKGT